jgi:hypothetical protein
MGSLPHRGVKVHFQPLLERGDADAASMPVPARDPEMVVTIFLTKI